MSFTLRDHSSRGNEASQYLRSVVALRVATTALPASAGASADAAADSPSAPLVRAFASHACTAAPGAHSHLWSACTQSRFADKPLFEVRHIASIVSTIAPCSRSATCGNILCATRSNAEMCSTSWPSVMRLKKRVLSAEGMIATPPPRGVPPPLSLLLCAAAFPASAIEQYATQS